MKKIIIITFVISFSFIVLLGSFKKGDNTTDPAPPATTKDVYMVGNESTTNANSYAKLWKNEITKILGDSKNTSICLSVFVK